jgi:type VI secretion system secreted protein VgrG
MPPYTLPEEASVSGIKSRSLLSQNSEHFNEIRLDDRAGSEKFVIQAQKDLNGIVENDYTLDVNHHSTITIGNDQDITVKGKQTETVDGNHSLDVGRTPLTMNFTIDWNNIEIHKLTKSVVTGVVSDRVSGTETRVALVGSLSVVSGLSTDIVLGKRVDLTVGSISETVTGDRRERIRGIHSTTVGRSTTWKSTQNLTLAGNRRVQIEGGGSNGSQGRTNAHLSFKAGVPNKPASVEIKGYVIRLIAADLQDEVVFSLKDGVTALIQAGKDPESNKIELARDSIKITVDPNNYILMTPQGIVIKATSLELDIDTLVTQKRTQTKIL